MLTKIVNYTLFGVNNPLTPPIIPPVTSLSCIRRSLMTPKVPSENNTIVTPDGNPLA